MEKLWFYIIFVQAGTLWLNEKLEGDVLSAPLVMLQIWGCQKPRKSDVRYFWEKWCDVKGDAMMKKKHLQSLKSSFCLSHVRRQLAWLNKKDWKQGKPAAASFVLSRDKKKKKSVYLHI